MSSKFSINPNISKAETIPSDFYLNENIFEESKEKIFDRFYTERPKGEKFGEHSGLGLSISKQIIEVHNGSITAKNKINKNGKIAGARFTIMLKKIQ